MKHTVNFPLATRAAEVRPQSYNEADNTIDIIWTTGAAVRRYDWQSGGEYDEVLDLSKGAVRLDRLNAGAAILNTHARYDLSSVIGAVVPGSAKIEGGQGVCTVQLSRAAGDADVVQKIKDGVIRMWSAGYIRHRIEKTEDDAKVPVWRVTDWEPMEISAVPVPADPGAQTRSEAASTFPCEVRGLQVASAKVDTCPTLARMRMRAAAAKLG